MYLEVNSLKEMYEKLCPYIETFGHDVWVRGKKTREIIAPQIVLKNPKARLAYHPNRKFNVLFAITEGLMLVTKDNHVCNYSVFNKNIEQFSDDGVHMYGSYGMRIANLLPEAVQKLRDDETTRQCVLNIFSGDMCAKTKDVPCTISIQFLVRDDKLHMIVNMRSNDLIWGLPYDIFQFTMLQEAVANSLKLQLGDYIHQPASLHYYEYYGLEKGIDYVDMMGSKEVESIEFEHALTLSKYQIIADWFVGKRLPQEPFELTYVDEWCSFITKAIIARKKTEDHEVQRVLLDHHDFAFFWWTKKFLGERSNLIWG